MNNSILPANNLKTKIYWSLLLGISLVLCGFAVFQAAVFSLQEFLVLSGALAVSAFANQHQITIPKTSANFSAKEIIVFWGIIWLGVPGGVFLAVCASLARFYIVGKNKSRWLFGVFTDVCAAFAGGAVFYAILHNFGGFTADFGAAGKAELTWLIAAAVLMTATHYLLTAIPTSIFEHLEDENELPEIWKTNFVRTALSYSLSLVAVFLLHISFLEFGLMFGLVILPMTIAGYFAYRFHISRLEQKTKEIGEASRIHLATSLSVTFAGCRFTPSEWAKF